MVALLIFCPDFNPRTPCGVRRRDPYPENRGGGISIHAPHTGRDRIPGGLGGQPGDFNPRTPCGARRLPERAHRPHPCISIHAPLAGRDSGDPTHRSAPPYFNPRTPCGVRRNNKRVLQVLISISIHAPHAGRDYNVRAGGLTVIKFQSTRPLRGATAHSHQGGTA